MAGETPDYGRLSAQATVFPVTDLGELAARLGSIVTHDRRGDVIHLEDFASGLAKWSLLTSGTGATIDLTTSTARNGLFALRLVAGSDSSRLARVTYSTPLPAVSAFGVEASFTRLSFIDNISFQMTLNDGTTQLNFEVRWRDTDNDLQYLDSTGAFVTFATGVDLILVAGLFNTAKLVGDAVSRQYVRFILNDTVYSLANIAVQTSGSGTSSRLLHVITNTGRSGQNDTVIVDDVIVTHNEALL